MNKFLSLVSILIFIVGIEGYVVVVVKEYPACFLRHVKKDDLYKFQFSASAEDEEALVSFKITSPNGSFSKTVSNKNQDTGTFKTKTSDFYKFCFSTELDSPNFVSFSIQDYASHSLKKDFSIKNLINKSLSQLKDIENAAEMEYTRSHTHHQGLQKLESSLKFCASIKALVLLMISAAQVYILMNFFKEKKYQEMETEITTITT